MPPVRRAAPVAAPVTVVEGVNFGSLGFYSGSFTLPKGRYAMEHTVVMHTPTKQDGTPLGKPRLGVMLTAHPIAEDGSATGEPVEQFLSMGSKADASFAPDPNTGKSLVPVPGGPAATAPRNTNWNLYLKSLYDTGLPEGIFTNDISVLDGVWVLTDLVPEPEERKGYAKAATGEAATEQEERKGSGLVPVVTEIMEGGKPWEGTGGIPAPAAAAPVQTKAPVKPAAAAKAPARPVAAPVAEAPADDDALMTAAVNGVTVVLTAEPSGTSKLKLRTGTFKAVSATEGGEVAQAVIDTFFGNDEALNSVLGQLGFTIKGTNIVMAQ